MVIQWNPYIADTIRKYVSAEGWPLQRGFISTIVL